MAEEKEITKLMRDKRSSALLKIFIIGFILSVFWVVYYQKTNISYYLSGLFASIIASAILAIAMFFYYILKENSLTQEKIISGVKKSEAKLDFWNHILIAFFVSILFFIVCSFMLPIIAYLFL